MTLDEFITLEKINLEKFRDHHVKAARRVQWPADVSQSGWKQLYDKWWEIWSQWKKECGIE
jgi:hypothetical protein